MVKNRKPDMLVALASYLEFSLIIIILNFFEYNK